MADIKKTTFSESTATLRNEPSPNEETIKCDKIEPKATILQGNDSKRALMIIAKSDTEKEGTNNSTQTPVLQKMIQNRLKRKKKPLINLATHDSSLNTNKKRKTKTDSHSNSSHTTNSSGNTIEMVNQSNKENTQNNSGNTTTPHPVPKIVQPLKSDVENHIKGIDTEKRVVTKPPLPPPKTDKILLSQISSVIKAPPPRLKRKLEEQNSALVQKLSAHADQMRLEITDLKTALASEKTAVRALRAQNEADTRKAKAEAKKLQSALDLSKKVSTVGLAHKKAREDVAAVHCKDSAGDHSKLVQENSALKDANKTLEEKIQILIEAERRKVAEMREQKHSNEIRLTQITKSAKTEICRLLEEIKAKERNIGLLKKEVLTLKSSATKKDIRNVQHPTEMRKLKDFERTTNNNTTNQKCNITTCGEKGFNSMPHEITERILEAHDDLHIFENKDTISSDSDSALSSAPPSISPQPPANSADSPDIWQSVKNYTKELASLQSDNDSLQSENEFIKKELESAKEQIIDLERNILEAHKNNKNQQLLERIQFLEQKEDTLLKEAHELREQNELLEFRVLELEESHDKWSLRSNSTPDTRDMWTDTERDPDDLVMYVDRTDSGITSPHSHHHLDERNISSPYDLSMLDQISNDEIKRRLTAMAKRSGYDEDDRLCLLQVLSLLNNLEALSQDSVIGGEELMSIDMVKTKSSDYSSTSPSPRSFLTDSPPSYQKNKNGRIVATVLPYSSSLSTPTDSPRKYRSWNSNSLQESGVFEADSNDIQNQSTQTEAEDFPCQDNICTGDLCAEIQKLNKFREKIEESVTKSTSKVGVPAILSPNLSDQRRLQYYKERLELLENKVLVYESSGDQQTKRLADRLQREIQLNGIVKDLKERVNILEEENSQLEEEKCEFEEAENDTRLRLQRLEVDLEILNQRNIELEMSREAIQTKLKESRSQCACLQESVQKYQQRICTMEENEKELEHKIELIKTCMPAILLYNTYRSGFNPSADDMVDDEKKSLVLHHCACPADSHLQDKLHELMSREKELTQRISELNRAYDETLESADNLWAQMEKDYKDRLAIAKTTEACMKAKICQLEERLQCDAQFAQERITQLEEVETNLKHRVCKLNKDNKEISSERDSLLSEYQSVKDKYEELKKYVEGPAFENLEKERTKVRILEEDLNQISMALEDIERAHKSEVQFLRKQLSKVNKELQHIEVTNSELKEEVHTLEEQVLEYSKQRKADEDKIRTLTDELRSKEDQLCAASIMPAVIIGPSLAQELGPKPSISGPSLAHELGPIKRVNTEGIYDLGIASSRLAEAIANVEECSNCTPANAELTAMAKEVKILADDILGYRKKLKPSNEVGSEVSDKKPPSPPTPGSDGPSKIKNEEDNLSASTKASEFDNEIKRNIKNSKKEGVSDDIKPLVKPEIEKEEPIHKETTSISTQDDHVLLEPTKGKPMISVPDLRISVQAVKEEQFSEDEKAHSSEEEVVKTTSAFLKGRQHVDETAIIRDTIGDRHHIFGTAVVRGNEDSKSIANPVGSTENIYNLIGSTENIFDPDQMKKTIKFERFQKPSDLLDEPKIKMEGKRPTGGQNELLVREQNIASEQEEEKNTDLGLKDSSSVEVIEKKPTIITIENVTGLPTYHSDMPMKPLTFESNDDPVKSFSIKIKPNATAIFEVPSNMRKVSRSKRNFFKSNTEQQNKKLSKTSSHFRRSSQDTLALEQPAFNRTNLYRETKRDLTRNFSQENVTIIDKEDEDENQIQSDTLLETNNINSSEDKLEQPSSSTAIHVKRTVLDIKKQLSLLLLLTGIKKSKTKLKTQTIRKSISKRVEEAMESLSAESSKIETQKYSYSEIENGANFRNSVSKARQIISKDRGAYSKISARDRANDKKSDLVLFQPKNIQNTRSEIEDEQNEKHLRTDDILTESFDHQEQVENVSTHGKMQRDCDPLKHSSSKEREKIESLNKTSDHECTTIEIVYSSPDQPLDLKVTSKRRESLEELISRIREEVPESIRRDTIEDQLSSLYDNDIQFQNNLKLTLRLGRTNASATSVFDGTVIKSYEEIVRTMRCLHTISKLYAPLQINMLKTLEDEITKKLMVYYLNTEYSKIYCEVYIPKYRK